MDNVEVLEEFEYFFNELKVKIKVGKIYDEGTKKTLYFAKSNYKNIQNYVRMQLNIVLKKSNLNMILFMERLN